MQVKSRNSHEKHSQMTWTNEKEQGCKVHVLKRKDLTFKMVQNLMDMDS